MSTNTYKFILPYSLLYNIVQLPSSNKVQKVPYLYYLLDNLW